MLIKLNFQNLKNLSFNKNVNLLKKQKKHQKKKK